MMSVHVTEVYCENPDCNVREIEVFTKNFGDQPEPARWHCPGCGRPAKLHWRRTAREHHRMERRNAIGMVNCALYQRENRDPAHPNWPVMWPLSILIDTLPGSWKSVRPAKPTEGTHVHDD